MFKKIIATILGTAAITAIGIFRLIEISTPTAIPENIPENYINLDSIVDWNTDGEEISITLENDVEVYAYKSKSVYDDNDNHFASVAEIVGYEATETGILLKFSDGTGYYIDNDDYIPEELEQVELAVDKLYK